MGLVFAVAASAVAAQDPPETSHDGLTLVKHTTSRAVYMAPGASLEQYQRIHLQEAHVAFKKNWQRDYNRTVIGLERRISDDDADKIRQDLAAEFKKVFTDELETKGGYEIVDVAAEDVLILVPAIINLDVTAPDTNTPGMSRTFTASAGEMTLYLELYDSVSRSIIARIIDAQADRSAGSFGLGGSVSNRADADRILRRWADLLRGHLADVEADSGA